MVEGLNSRNTFSEKVADEYVRKGFPVVTRKIKLMSLNALLESFGEVIDYISIDVEGLEYEILKNFDFEKYGVSFFNIEKGDLRVKDLLLSNGYKLVSETISNWIFTINGLVDEERVLQNIRERI